MLFRWYDIAIIQSAICNLQSASAMPERQRHPATGIQLPGLDPAATPLIGIGLGIAGLLVGIRPRLAPLPIAITAAVATLLYRNPRRATPAAPAALFAPADGVIAEVAELYDHRFLHTDALRISIKAAPLDVPIQRSPAAGAIAYLEAFTPPQLTATEQPARLYIGLNTDWGPIAIAVTAGPLTRQVVSDVAVGDLVAAGDRIGIARIGARTDLIVPLDMVAVLPEAGARMRAGETPIGQVVPLE
jgi:phosphatidylserine decarboxylase